MTTYYAVTAVESGKRMFAVRNFHNPQLIYPPERRCLFQRESQANELLRFLKQNSSFHNIRIETRDVQ